MRKLHCVSIAALLISLFSCGEGQSGEFVVGITHAAGNYGFTTNNFLVEGAQQISQMGSDAIFIYLTPSFSAIYPDQSANLWPPTQPTSLAELAQTRPYDQVFHMPFKTIVITAYTFANTGTDWSQNGWNYVAGMAQSPARQQAEQNEFYQLTKYLYSKFSGSGKTFILKNWESDWMALFSVPQHGNIPADVAADMIAWFKARQGGVTQARQEANDPTMRVLNGVEVNRVLDYAQGGITRVINTIVPEVNADMVTYSSYDSTSIGQNAAEMEQSFNLALQTIEKLAPDPLGMGNRRILISEYGLFENSLIGGTTWRASAILATASHAGTYGAFLWELYDNECVEPDGQPAPVDTPVGSPARPTDSDCQGLWVMRPDGTTSAVLAVLKQYWQ